MWELFKVLPCVPALKICPLSVGLTAQKLQRRKLTSSHFPLPPVETFKYPLIMWISTLMPAKLVETIISNENKHLRGVTHPSNRFQLAPAMEICSKRMGGDERKPSRWKKSRLNTTPVKKKKDNTAKVVLLREGWKRHH